MVDITKITLTLHPVFDRHRFIQSCIKIGRLYAFSAGYVAVDFNRWNYLVYNLQFCLLRKLLISFYS